MSDPIERALEQVEIAGQELEEASHLLEMLREEDRKRFTARIRPHWDFCVTAIEERVRREIARDIEASKRDLTAPTGIADVDAILAQAGHAAALDHAARIARGGAQ